jgi:5'(3')-deoxyribonucleotidase
LVEHKGFPEYQLKDSTTWNFFKDDWGMELDEYLQHFADGVDAGIVFLHGPAEEGAVKYIKKLREDGHTIHIVTWRAMGTKSIQNTGEWLHREGIEFDTLTFAKDKRVVPTDIFIEDNMDNFKSLEAHGVRAVIMDRPWNCELETEWRVKNWAEFYNLVCDEMGLHQIA